MLGRWVHLGDGNRLRAHEGTLRVGDKCVFGRDNTVNCYLDIEFGARSLVADWVYVCDFDHRFDDLTVPIKDQGIVKTPVRIGPDVWVGVKATILRGAMVGEGSVLAAHTVVRGRGAGLERCRRRARPGRAQPSGPHSAQRAGDHAGTSTALPAGAPAGPAAHGRPRLGQRQADHDGHHDG